MNIRRRCTIACMTAIVTLLVVACSDSDSQNEEISQDVTIKFAAKVNGADFNCGQTFTQVGTGPHDYKANDFRLFIHDVHFRSNTDTSYPVALTQDGIWQYENLALLDFENGCASGTTESNTQVIGTVTHERKDDLDLNLDDTQLCFTVGVPNNLNHVDSATAQSPLNDSSMQWNWKVGYKYIRIDGFGDPQGVNEAFHIHLGAQGCPGASTTAAPGSDCSIPNTVNVCIDNFDTTNDRVAVDAGAVLEANDISTNMNQGPTARPGCMSFIDDNDCEEIMPRLGLNYSYGRSLTGVESNYTGGQKMFTKE